jgi:hypothetical protein
MYHDRQYTRYGPSSLFIFTYTIIRYIINYFGILIKEYQEIELVLVLVQ